MIRGGGEFIFLLKLAKQKTKVLKKDYDLLRINFRDVRGYIYLYSEQKLLFMVVFSHYCIFLMKMDLNIVGIT